MAIWGPKLCNPQAVSVAEVEGHENRLKLRSILSKKQATWRVSHSYQQHPVPSSVVKMKVRVKRGCGAASDAHVYRARPCLRCLAT